MNIDLIKKIIDAKVVRGLDKDLPDAHLFGWDPEPHITEYELINVKLDIVIITDVSVLTLT
jgi:hypothetical protein